MKSFKVLAMCFALSVVGCKEGCSFGDVADKAMQYKDKVKPEHLDKAKELKDLF